MTQHELLGRIDIFFGGRVAEEVMFNEVSTGAQDDLQKATDIAKRMIMEYGMSRDCGQRTFAGERSAFIQGPGGQLGYSKEFSEATAEKIDAEIQRILDESYARVKQANHFEERSSCPCRGHPFRERNGRREGISGDDP